MQNNVLKDRTFIKNSGKLFGSSLISQLIPFIILPFLTRMYSPEDFGFWAYFLSLSGMVSILMTGNYEFAVVMPKDKKDALNVMSGSVLITLASYIFGTAVIAVFFRPAAKGEFFGVTESTAYMIISMAMIMALFRLLNYWNNRENKFHVTAGGNIIRSFSVSAFQFLNGFYLNPSHFGLILSSVAGYILGTVVQARSFFSAVILNKKEIDPRSIKRVLARYRDFPKYFMPSEFLNNISSSVPVIFLTNIFDTAAAGLYAVPHRFINVPLMLMGSSISQAYLKKSSDMVNSNQDIGKVTSDIYKKLFMLGVIPLSVISGYGDIVFMYLLGEKWMVSGLYASLLSPWMLMVFVASPVSVIFATLEKQKISLMLNIFLLAIRIASFIVGGIMFKSVFTAVFLYGASGMFFWTFYSFFVVRVSGTEKDRDDIVKFALFRLIFIMLPVILSRSVVNAFI